MRGKITVDLGPLHELLQEHCQSTGKRPSDVVRQAVARLLKVKPPAMDGNLANLRQYKKQTPPDKE
jgi:hypothetical protein